jgi:polyhydroxyalkanoate synthesis regulator phasin
MVKKNITIDDLAVMVQKGFAGQDEKFEKIDKKFDDMKRDLTFIKGQLADVVHQSEFDKLEGRVEYLENMLKISASKK